MVKNFLVKRGDQLSFTVTFTTDTTVTAMEFGVKTKYSDDYYTIVKSIGNGITQISTNKFQITLNPEDTKRLEIRKYVYDLRYKSSSVVKTPLSGKLIIQDTVFED